MLAWEHSFGQAIGRDGRFVNAREEAIVLMDREAMVRAS